MKKGVLKNFANFAGKHLCWSLLETETQVFSYEICEFFKNTYFEKHLRTTAFGGWKGNSNCITTR